MMRVENNPYHLTNTTSQLLLVQQIMISHYATGEVNAVNLQFTFGDPLRTHPVIVFISTVNND